MEHWGTMQCSAVLCKFAIRTLQHSGAIWSRLESGKIYPLLCREIRLSLERRSLESGNRPYLPNRPRRTAEPKSLYYGQNAWIELQYRIGRTFKIKILKPSIIRFNISSFTQPPRRFRPYTRASIVYVRISRSGKKWQKIVKKRTAWRS